LEEPRHPETFLPYKRYERLRENPSANRVSNENSKTMAGEIEGALQSAAAITDQRQKIEQYKLILASIFSSNNVQNAKAFIDHSKPYSQLANPRT
jgi:hypothetical protein